MVHIELREEIRFWGEKFLEMGVGETAQPVTCLPSGNEDLNLDSQNPSIKSRVCVLCTCNSSAGEVGHGPWGSMAGLPWMVSFRPGRDPDSKSKVRNHMNRHAYLHTHTGAPHIHTCIKFKSQTWWSTKTHTKFSEWNRHRAWSGPWRTEKREHI